MYKQLITIANNRKEDVESKHEKTLTGSDFFFLSYSTIHNVARPIVVFSSFLRT